ncbi:MAG TPA: ferritin-like domain-containing protein [Stellaceae bacterium]|nr:ferritin-like domain-containing protein [Stellaceae bacterium]
MSLSDEAQSRDDGAGPHRSWSLADIPYERLDRPLVRDDRRLFELVAAASFIEITSEIYTRNLVEFCGGDDEVVEWLDQGWRHEEMQHGAALRRYVETAWPEFDWEEAYRGFLEEYMQFCSVDLYEKTRALEMVARCVVETGTATFYRMLSDASPEPVLRRLAAFISRDEVDHYKHFYRYFRLYAEREKPGRAAVLRTLVARTNEVDAEDAAIAFKHVRLAASPGAEFRAEDYVAFRHGVRVLALPHYRFDMAVKMLLRPLDLGALASRVVVPLGTAMARRFLFA